MQDDDFNTTSKPLKRLFVFFTSPREVILSLRVLSSKEKIILLILFFVFIISIGGILFKVNKSYSVEIPDFGGSINEAVIGAPRFINPLLAVSDTDRDLVKLIYSGLLDSDGKGGLLPVIASGYEISDDGLIYTFYINKKAKWQDGARITADDVVFTIKKAKDPVLNSVHRANWEGVEIEKIDDYTIKFYLKKSYAQFLENATLPILPKHILENISSNELPLSNFNLNPVGGGPYKVKKISRNSSGIITVYKLKANKNFVLGRPNIKYVNVYFFPSEEKLIEDFKQGKIDSTGFISPLNIRGIIKKDSNVKKLALPRIFGLFFNSAKNSAIENKEVREAMSLAIDKEFLINEVLKGYGMPINSPVFLKNKNLKTENNEKLNEEERISSAKKILEKNGWKLNNENIYEKEINKKLVKLNFNISTSNSNDLNKTAEILKEKWEKIGIKTNLNIYETGDLEQSVIRPRNYEILLFGEMVGNDPDPFVFWHSSQRTDPGLNIAMYANTSVDKILEEARSEINPDKRLEKYKLFEQKIIEDKAAIFLFSPYFVYILPERLNGFDAQNISMPQERFSLINKWYIYKSRVWAIFLR